MISGECCRQCGLPLTSEEQLCLRCRELEEPGPAGRALFFYHGTARVLLQRYKFEGVRGLSGIIAEELLRELTEEEAKAVIVPIPSGNNSRRRNGWGHMEQVAACLSRRGIRVRQDLLVRRAGKEQKKLDRKGREENSRFVFRSSGKSSSEAVVLIDDVRTTGASIRAACAALEAGGTHVKSWIVFAID
jgi:ComF family protein